jgi:hypothetical protein
MLYVHFTSIPMRSLRILSVRMEKNDGVWTIWL